MSGAITPTSDLTAAERNSRSVSRSSSDRRKVASGGSDLDAVQAAAQVVAEHLPAGFTAKFDPGNTKNIFIEQLENKSPSTTATPGSTLGENARPSALSSHTTSSANYGGTTASSAADLLQSLATRTQEEAESSLKLQGGDIHRELFRIAADAQAQALGAHRRANTFHTPREL